MRKFWVVALCAVAVACSKPALNRNYMWFDCEANYKVLSHPDSIMHYLQKVKNLGFGNVVVDMKSIMGEVLYDSQIAPYMSPFDGVERPRNYDMMGYFIQYGHELGLNVYSSLNVFCGGHNFMDRGIIYDEHPEWQSICYHQGSLVPISTIKTNYNGMVNPVNPDVRRYELDILKEFVSAYPECDGLIFDRVRFDGITADFSDISRSAFEDWSGETVANWPEDIISWYDESGELRQEWTRGRRFNEWCEWRASVIHDFVEQTRSELKAINPDLVIGDYTGAWYPTYFNEGVNWASREYDPSEEYDWATPTYSRTGYAELLDVYMTGLYYSALTKEDNKLYSVEGGAQLAQKVTMGVVPVVGSIYVEQYIGEMEKFAPAVEQALASTGGVMVFDISHLSKHHLWEDLEGAMRRSGQMK